MDESNASLAELLADLADDPRGVDSLSTEVLEATERLLAAENDDLRADILNRWLEQHQPCIFGQMAARMQRISYCFLTEADFASDRRVRGTIAKARRAWRRQARDGAKHGFLIVALSRRLAFAEPNAALQRVALRLASLYLNREIQPNVIYHDELFLDTGDSARKWRVGVDYFSPQGDGRWWQDHRIPGGVVYSMNSVGHMSRCLRAGKSFRGAHDSGGLLWALTTAMTLIDNTRDGVSGRDTWLWESAKVAPTVACPYQDGMPPKLVDKNYCQYGGLYHTDESVPSEYFDSSPERRSGAPTADDLDLTYLHDDSAENPDYLTTGIGEIVPQATQT